MTNLTTAKKKRLAWFIWAIASLFYSMEFFQRVSPTVMANPIMHSLHLNDATFAFIISCYFYACAAAQIPVGYLLDRYSIRYLLSIACFSVSVGSLLFATSHSITLLIISRLLIGAGSAFAFIGVLKLSSHWFSEKQYPVMVGLTNTVGVIGAIAGEAPFAKLVNYLGWQQSLITISIVGFVISALLFLFIREHPACIESPKDYFKTVRDNKKQSIGAAIKVVLSDKQTWLTAIYAGLMVAPIIAFAELWGVPFLSTVYHLDAITASSLNTLIFVGIAVGGPLNGLLVSVFGSRKLVMCLGNIIALLALLAIIYGQGFNIAELSILLFSFGFFTSSMLIAFTVNKERHTLEHNATVLGFTNMMILILGAAYQDLTGKLLSVISNDHLALLILPVTLLFNLILLAFIKTK